jgi:hypothetical protein
MKFDPNFQLVSLTNYAVPSIWDTAPPELREFIGLPPVMGPQCACASTEWADL